MAEINFYQTDENPIKSMAPLLLKVLEENKKTLIFCEDEKQIKEVDSALWSYGRSSFIPHITSFDDGFDFLRQPIVITNQERNLNEAQYLIFLKEPSESFVKKFSRVFYFFENGGNKSSLKPNNSYKKEDGKWIK